MRKLYSGKYRNIHAMISPSLMTSSNLVFFWLGRVSSWTWTWSITIIGGFACIVKFSSAYISFQNLRCLKFFPKGKLIFWDMITNRARGGKRKQHMWLSLINYLFLDKKLSSELKRKHKIKVYSERMVQLLNITIWSYQEQWTSHIGI